jgi:hypothetical protein
VFLINALAVIEAANSRLSANRKLCGCWRKCMVRRRTARALKLGEGIVRVNGSANT